MLWKLRESSEVTIMPHNKFISLVIWYEFARHALYGLISRYLLLLLLTGTGEMVHVVHVGICYILFVFNNMIENA